MVVLISWCSGFLLLALTIECSSWTGDDGRRLQSRNRNRETRHPSERSQIGRSINQPYTGDSMQKPSRIASRKRQSDFELQHRKRFSGKRLPPKRSRHRPASRRRLSTRGHKNARRYSTLQECKNNFIANVSRPHQTIPDPEPIQSNVHCRLRLAVDPMFVETIADQSPLRAELMIESLVLRAERVFARTKFVGERQKRVSGIGVGLGSVFIRTTYDLWNRNSPYSRGRLMNNLYEVMQYFGWTDVRANEAYCAGVLFTARDYRSCPDTVVGYIGAVESDTGICGTQRRHVEIDERYNYSEFITPNIAVVNAIERGRVLSTAEMLLALLRGLGTIWGASPDASDDSIMGSGQDRRLEFSEESIGEMSKLLEYKQWCFSTSGSCGNFVVEPGEQCDEGHDGGPCCEAGCTLRVGAWCSDLNHDCCSQCTIEPMGYLCGRSNDDCIQPDRCTGRSTTCERSKAAEDGTLCRNYGRCRGGQCQHICELVHLPACECLGKDACKICCESSGRCEPFEPALFLDNGSPCGGNDLPGGVCLNRTCVDYCTKFGMQGCACPDSKEASGKLCCKLAHSACRPMIDFARSVEDL